MTVNRIDTANAENLQTGLGTAINDVVATAAGSAAAALASANAASGSAAAALASANAASGSAIAADGNATAAAGSAAAALVSQNAASVSQGAAAASAIAADLSAVAAAAALAALNTPVTVGPGQTVVAEVGRTYFIDSVGGSAVLSPPASAVNGDKVFICNGLQDWTATPATIMGLGVVAGVQTRGMRISVYDSGPGGWYTSSALA